MGRPRAASLLLAALAAAFLLAACGSSGNGELLPGHTAEQINSNLDLVRASIAEGNCEGAEDAVAEVSTEVGELDKVNKELQSALKEGAAKLSEVVSSCSAKEEAEEQKAAERKTEEEEQEALEAEERTEEEEFAKEQKEEEREEKAQEKAEKHAEQPGPSGEGEGEESGPKGKAKGHEEETEPPSEEEVTPPSEGGPAGGIGPGAAVEGGQ
ncbi:MAG: hypothetical protein JSS68_21115 [Actinobacteria bacterium]|nr:hypothetical protein [Actinomycetota bacterium]